MALRAGAILDADGATFTVRGWWMMCWGWYSVTAWYESVWCITTLVSCRLDSSIRKEKLIISQVEEIDNYVKVLNEVLPRQ